MHMYGNISGWSIIGENIMNKYNHLNKLDVLWETVNEGNPDWQGEFDLIHNGEICYAVLNDAYYLHDFTPEFNMVNCDYE